MPKHSIVRHWSLEDARGELDRIQKKIQARGMTVQELRYAAEEWDLDRESRLLLERYEKFAEMVRFSLEESSS